MNKYMYGAGALVLVIGVIIISQAGGAKHASVTQAPGATGTVPQQAAAGAGAGATAPSTSPQDIVPGLYPNQIQNTSTTPGIKITSMLVENNTNAAGTPVSDHLQVTLQNLTAKTLSDPAVYYTVTDVATGKKEGYYRVLTGFSLAPHGSGTVHFDGQSGYGHYPVNMHGVYGTGTDSLKIAVEVSVSGYAPVSSSAIKSPGGAEVVGK